MLGLVRVCLKQIQSLRLFELERSKSFRMFIVYMNMIGMFAYYIHCTIYLFADNCRRKCDPCSCAHFDFWHYTGIKQG